MTSIEIVRRPAAPFAVFVAIQSDKRVLFITAYRKDEVTFPGGRGIVGEEVVNAGVRKVLEEVGVPFDPDTLRQEVTRINSNGQPQHLLSIHVPDNFFNCLRDTGPKGHKIHVVEKTALPSLKLPPFITQLILLTQTKT